MTEIIRTAALPAAVILCYSAIELLKRTRIGNSKIKKLYPLISTMIGGLLGLIAFFADSAIGSGDELLEWALKGMASGLSATGADQVLDLLRKHGEKIKKEETEERG